MLLAIDTCGPVGGVAVGELSTPRGDGPSRVTGISAREMPGKMYSELLLAAVGDLLLDAALPLERLQAIAVVSGPGSFTGIRIGVSAAKGLAEALGIPTIAISRLELLARKADGASAMAVLDAGRGEFFAGTYWSGVRETELLLGREWLVAALAATRLPLLVCEERVMSELSPFGAERMTPPNAIDALAVASDRFQAGTFDDVAALDANYLRQSDTEMLARIQEHAARQSAAAHRP